MDFFKSYNDTYGHVYGDNCLKKVGRFLDKAINRPADIVARYGGEEFIVVLSETDEKGALTKAREKARQARWGMMESLADPCERLKTASNLLPGSVARPY